MFHLRLQDPRQLRLVALQKRQRALGENDPEPVGRAFRVLLGDLDPPGGWRRLASSEKQEPGRSGPDYGDAHLMTASYFTGGPPGSACDRVIVHEIPRGLFTCDLELILHGKNRL